MKKLTNSVLYQSSFNFSKYRVLKNNTVCYFMPCHQGMLREFGPPYNIERFHGIVFTSKSNVTLIKKDPTSTSSHLWSKILSFRLFCSISNKVLTHPGGCSNVLIRVPMDSSTSLFKWPSKNPQSQFFNRKKTLKSLKQIEKWQMVGTFFGH